MWRLNMFAYEEEKRNCNQATTAASAASNDCALISGHNK